MAEVRFGEPAGCGIPQERCHIVLNRVHREALPVAEVERLAGRKFFAPPPNDYARILASILECGPVAPETRF